MKAVTQQKKSETTAEAVIMDETVKHSKNSIMNIPTTTV